MAGAQVQLVKGEFSFKDGLLYKQEDWTYCTPQDRRFYTEVVDSGPGIKPAGECQLTNDEKAPEIPAGCYDAGDGYFDPERRAVFAYGSTDKQVRRPAAAETKWLVGKGRVGTQASSAASGATADEGGKAEAE